MTPTTLATLFAMKRSDISLKGDAYALNHRLKLPPWMPVAIEVWKFRKPPADLPETQRGHWFEVLTILDELHEEHLRRKDDDE